MPEIESLVSDAASQRAILEATDLPTERGRNGHPTLTFRGVRLHSIVDPHAEAETLLDSYRSELDALLKHAGDQSATCFVCGAGLGYIVRALGDYATTTNSDAQLQIVCVETDAEVARKALQLRVWEPCTLNVSWVVANSIIEALNSWKDTAHKLFIIGTTGYRINKDSYDDALHMLRSRPVAQRPMRILVPTPLYGGSLPIALHCADAFRQLGHHVELLDLSPNHSLYQATEAATRNRKHCRTLQGLLATYFSELIAARAIDMNADLVWAVAQTPLTSVALEELRHEGIHSALWFVEDYTVFDYWRELAPHFDAIFTIQRGEFHEELKSIGVKHMSYLPCAANPAIHKPEQLSDAARARYGSDVSFVGAGYSNRQRLFADLALTNFKIWGADWPENSPAWPYVQEGSRRVTPEETSLIYSATQVNINLHSSPHHAGVNPDGDYVNPRTFEIAASGGFQLLDVRSELGTLFKANDEVIVFRNAAEIPDLVSHYLAHPEEREQVAERGRQRVLKEHTYAHRMTVALEFLESRFRRLAERKRGPNYVASLKEAAGDDQELLDLLSKFPDDEEIDLDTIVSRIELGNGELTRAEGIFLLMKEFRDWGREKGVIQ